MRFSAKITVFVLCFLCTVFLSCADASATENNNVSIVFTNSLSSHIDSDVFIKSEEEYYERGGFGKIYSVVNAIKEIYPDTFFFDGGNFSVGTPYQLITSSHAVELQMMGLIGVDVSTLGANEFANGLSAAAAMIRATGVAELPIPKLTVGNIDWEKTKKRASSIELDELKRAVDRYRLNEDYVLVTRGEVDIAVFSVYAQPEEDASARGELVFSDCYDRAEEIVKEIKKDDIADIIVCIASLGAVENYADKKSPFVEFISKVEDVDVIIDSDAREGISETLKIEDTVIVAADRYGYSLGHLVFERTPYGSYNIAEYNLIPINTGVIPEDSVLLQADEFKAAANEEYFSKYRYKWQQVLAESDFDFTSLDDFALSTAEDGFGNMIADSYINAVKQAEGKKYINVDVAVVCGDMIKDTLKKGEITVADVYSCLPAGYSNDQSPASPLVTFYLTGKELKHLAEVDATIAVEKDAKMQLYFSGLNYTVDDKRMKLNRAINFTVDTKDGRVEIDDAKLYRIACDLHTIQQLRIVDKETYSLIAILPKTSKGKPLENIASNIVQSGGVPVKAWSALASYIETFEPLEEDGLPQMSSYYKTTHERKTEISKGGFSKIFDQPNKMLLIWSIVVVLAIILLWVILWFVFFFKKIIDNKRRRNMFS